MVLTGH